MNVVDVKVLYKYKVRFWKLHGDERWKKVWGGEQGLEEKILQGNEAVSSSQTSPCLSILLTQTSGWKPHLPRAQSLPWAEGAFDSQRLLPQARETGFVLCHFPQKNCCKQPNGYHYFSGNSLLHYFVRDGGRATGRGGGRRSEENHLG